MSEIEKVAANQIKIKSIRKSVETGCRPTGATCSGNGDDGADKPPC